jgi:tryptophanyl-tRNA synthetase
LINIYALLSSQSTEEIEKMYQGKGYADFKIGLADVVVAFLTDFQAKYAAISDEEVLVVLRNGAEKARLIAQKKMETIKKAVGFVI